MHGKKKTTKVATVSGKRIKIVFQPLGSPVWWTGLSREPEQGGEDQSENGGDQQADEEQTKNNSQCPYGGKPGFGQNGNRHAGQGHPNRQQQPEMVLLLSMQSYST